MNKQGRVLYVGEDIGIEHTANFIHMLNISRIFEALNYEVSALSVNGKPEGRTEETEIMREGIRFFYTKDRRKSNNRIIDKYYIFRDNLQEKPLWKKYEELYNALSPDIVVLYGAFALENKIIKHAKKKKTIVLIDRTDWFERFERIGFAYKYWVQTWDDLCLKKFDYRASGVIAISDYLVKHYGSKVPVIWIPALCDDINREGIVARRNGQFVITYAGIPGSKENLKSFVEVVSDLNKQGVNIQLKLMGPDEQYVTNLVGTDSWKRNGVEAFGLIPHEKVLKIIRESDMSLLPCVKRRSMQVSFSTKFAESMRLGVPVLCTRVGGTDTCVIDMENGFLIDDCEYNTVYDKLLELIAISPNEWMVIKNNVYMYAKDRFDFRNYIDEMQDFIMQIKENLYD